MSGSVIVSEERSRRVADFSFRIHKKSDLKFTSALYKNNKTQR